MKFTLISIAVFLTSLFAQTRADIDFEPFPEKVEIGHTYTLNWHASAKYIYTLWLVLENPTPNSASYIKLSKIVEGLQFDSLDISYNWTIPKDITTSDNHAVVAAAIAVSSIQQYHYNQTNWFRAYLGDLPTTESPTASPTTSGGAVPTSTVTEAPTETSSEVPSSDNHSNSPSGGTIAGIVIGCLVAVALIIGGVLFYLWRRKRTGVQKREAAARASRLAPVMEENSPAYELHHTPPQKVKSSAV